MATIPTLLTAEEFAAMTWKDDGIQRELKDGELIEMARARFGHERVKSKANSILCEWALRADGGEVFSETEYQLEEHLAYAPDVSFLK